MGTLIIGGWADVPGYLEHTKNSPRAIEVLAAVDSMLVQENVLVRT
jgi:hypothetical protein